MKRKLERFKELLTFDRVFQPEVDSIADKPGLKGKWSDQVFGNDNDIVLELGCGRGEYTVGLARKYSDKNFIGIDIKGARLWRGAKTGHEENILNTAFMRTKIELLGYFFDENEVSEIWLTFPDPQPKAIKENRRLTNMTFLETYIRILKPNGIFHLKTDNRDLFDYTVQNLNGMKGEFLCKTYDLYKDIKNDDILSIQTTYEAIFLKQGISINYLKYRF
ncbi:MAG: tRNA (guanosine(46)-N7)-methyltransferase TrmB [Bacteroidia bacterium]|nr:tRNA (guanosine(46)-N7)-methyltransferase TrmB [Bacteroidia bacterium]